MISVGDNSTRTVGVQPGPAPKIPSTFDVGVVELILHCFPSEQLPQHT